MKQTVFNFNQQAILDLTKINDEEKEIKLDATDLLILDWFIYFTPNMTSINVNGKIYYWLSYSKLQEDLPFLDFKKRTFTDKLKKLCDLEILSFHYEKNQGSITYYGFGNNYLRLIEDTNRCATNDRGCSQDNNGVAVKTTTGLQSKQQTYSSINNNSINNSSNNIYNINNNNKEINKESIKEKESEHHFGTYGRIMLTTSEYNKLCDDYTKNYIDKVIEKLDEYVEINNNKNKYKKFNLVIRKAIRENWSIIKDLEKAKNNNKWDGYKFNEI